MIITTGIIRDINLSSGNLNNNIFKVEIPLFNTAIDDKSTSCILDCNACLLNSFSNVYNVGDLVYLGFIDGLFSQPVILGNIYSGNNVETGDLKLGSLKVKDSVELPENTFIGDINIQRLIKNIQEIQNLNSYISILKERSITGSGEQTHFTDAYLKQDSSGNLTWDPINKLNINYDDINSSIIDISKNKYTQINNISEADININLNNFDSNTLNKYEFQLNCENIKNNLVINFTNDFNFIYLINSYGKLRDVTYKILNKNSVQFNIKNLNIEGTITLNFIVKENSVYISIVA